MDIPSSGSWLNITIAFPFDAKVAVINRVGVVNGTRMAWTNGPFWKRLKTGAIEATYTPDQLEFCLAAVGRLGGKETA